MNDDDYYFDSAENTKLASLFGTELEAGNSSLIYKAPKPPNKLPSSDSNSTTKTFHKLVRLYQSNGEFLGKYIIAIINSKQGIAEVLVYQTKNNIHIRSSIQEKQLFIDNKNFSIVLCEDSDKFKLTFETEKDFLDFTCEYIKHGGKISALQQLVGSTICDQESSIRENTPIENSIIKDPVPFKFDEDEKKNIVNRLEKMGLPLLPFPVSKDNMNNDLISNKDKMVNSGNNINIEDVPLSTNEATPKEPAPVLSEFIPKKQTELLTAVLIDNLMNSNKLRETINLLNSSLQEIIPPRESNHENNIKKLKSRIKCLELKNENLQSELNKLRKENEHESCQSEEKNKFSSKQTYILEDIACQTDNVDYDILSLIPIRVFEIVKTLPWKKNEVEELKKIRHEIKCSEVMMYLEPYFTFIEQLKTEDEDNQTCKDVLKNEFVTELKQIMNNMYQNICTSEVNNDKKTSIAKQVKQASLELIKLYNTSEKKISELYSP